MMAQLVEEILQPISTPAPNLGPPGVIRDLAPSIVDNVLGNMHPLKLLGLVDLTNCSVECYCGHSFLRVFCPCGQTHQNWTFFLKKSFQNKQSKKLHQMVLVLIFWNH